MIIKNLQSRLFVIILFLVCWFYGYQDILFKPPQSAHKWRQADCASITLNYYQYGLNFFEPQVHNLTSNGGKTGQCATSELPILYFFTSQLYHLTGPNDSILRFLNTLLFLVGLFYLYRLFELITLEFFWAASLTLLIFSSPVLVFYGNNFLSDTPALAMSIVAWFYFLRYHLQNNQRDWHKAIFFAMLAGFFKVSALLTLFAFIGILIIKQLRENRKVVLDYKKYQKAFIIPPIIAIGLVMFWIFYAAYYNKKYDCTYFSTTIFPIWDLKPELISYIFNNINKLWVPEYFSTSIYLLLGICLLFCTWFYRKGWNILLLGLAVLLAQAIVFVLLQFWTFNDHDYYTINLYIIPIIILANTAYILKNKFNKFFASWVLKATMVILLLFNWWYAKEKLNNRYTGWMNEYPAHENLDGIQPYLKSIGISPGDTAISIPDFSHVSLYLTNLRGWTLYSDARFNRGEKIYYNNDSAGIAASVEKGAKYLLINGLDELIKRQYLHSFTHYLLGKYETVLIFKLDTNVQNFNVKSVTDTTFYLNNAEITDGDYFIDALARKYEFANTQTDEKSFTGKYSVKLNKDQLYSMTTAFENLELGDSFKISGWRLGNVAIVLASEEEGLYYNNQMTIENRNAKGWEMVTKEVYIPENLIGKTIKIYLVYDGTGDCFFDDLSIQYIKRKLNF